MLKRIGELGAASRAEVVDLAGLAVPGQQAIAADHVADVGEVADDLEVADLDVGLAPCLHLGNLERQRRQDVRRRLPRAGMVERPDHHHVGPVRQVVLDAQEVGRGLAGRVRVVGAERAVLPHRKMLRAGVAVADARADQDHPRPGLQGRGLDRLQQVERAAQVQRPGAARVGQAGMGIGLRGQVIDHLGLLAPQPVGELDSSTSARSPRSSRTDRPGAPAPQASGPRPRARRPGLPRPPGARRDGRPRTRAPVTSTRIGGSSHLPVGPRADAVDPSGVGLVPLHGLGQSLLEGDGLAPAQLRLGLGAVHGVAAVVAQPVGDVADQVLRLSGQPEHGPGHVHVVPLAPAAEVVDLARTAAAERGVDAPAVVADVDPVADLHAVAIDGQGDVRQGVGDEQRDQLLGELVGAIVVRAAGDHRIQPVRVVGGADQEIGPGLAGGVGAVGRQRRGLGERRVVGPERAIDLVGGDLDVARHLRLPRGVEQALRPQDVGAEERRGIVDRSIHVALGREIDDRVELAAGDQLQHLRAVGDVAVHEPIPGMLREVRQVVRVAGVRQRVEVGDRGLRVGLQLQANEVGADEPAAARDQNPFDRDLHAHPR